MRRKPISVKKQVKTSVAFVWIGALVALLSQSLGSWCLWVGLGIVVIAAIYRFTMIRCPHCGFKLIDGSTAPNRCPNCGEALD